MSNYKIVTQATTEPITLAEAKAQLRIDHTDEDTLITMYIKAARQHAERFLGLSLAAQTVEYVYTDGELEFELPLSPVASITTVTNGTDALTYTANLKAVPATITLDAESDAVVTYVTSAAMLETDVKFALLLLISHIYDNRGMSDANVIERIQEAYLRVHRVSRGYA